MGRARRRFNRREAAQLIGETVIHVAVMGLVSPNDQDDVA
jgi:hypothetical protein